MQESHAEQRIFELIAEKANYYARLIRTLEELRESREAISDMVDEMIAKMEAAIETAVD